MKRKVIILLSVVFILLMSALFVYYLIKGDSSRWQVALGGILVSGLPLLLIFKKKNPFNLPIIIGYYMFIFCTLFLGSIASFYLHYKWWDSTIHILKGIYVAFVGITLFKLFIPKDVRNDASRWILFLFVLSLSVLASALWEIYEFVGDQTFTHTMQRGGNKDTMYDLLCGFAGGLLVSLYAFVRKPKV
ncbi:membrane-spanning protein [Neobacillus sp. C211]|uniref:membrane-spanning protein n=1 Tax=unclassified Neobacillus TaxID=2675272 RepID=UPI003979F2AD